MIRRLLLPLSSVALLLGLLAGRAHAEAFVRVIAQKTLVHSGPGGNYRTVYEAERGQVFEVIEQGCFQIAAVGVPGADVGCVELENTETIIKIQQGVFRFYFYRSSTKPFFGQL